MSSPSVNRQVSGGGATLREEVSVAMNDLSYCDVTERMFSEFERVHPLQGQYNFFNPNRAACQDTANVYFGVVVAGRRLLLEISIQEVEGDGLVGSSEVGSVTSYLVYYNYGHKSHRGESLCSSVGWPKFSCGRY